MAKETEKEALITLDFSGTEKKFADTDELRDFMQSQKSAWSWLKQAAEESGHLYRVWDPFMRYFKQADQFIQSYNMFQKQNEDQIKFLNIIKFKIRLFNFLISPIRLYIAAIFKLGSFSNSRNKTRLINSFRNNTQIAVEQGFTLVGSQNASFVLDLKNIRSPQIAGYALAFLSNTSIGASNPTAYEGAYWAMKYRQGSTPDSIKEQKKVHDSVEQAWKERLEKQYEDLGERNKQLVRETTMLKEHSALLIKKAENQAAEQASQFKTIRNEEEKRLTILVDTFKEKMELNESISYWTKKRDYHRIMVILTAISTVVIAAFFAMLFTANAISLFATPQTTTDGTESITPFFSKFIVVPNLATSGTTAPRITTTTTITDTTITTTIISNVNEDVWSTDNLWKISVMILISTIGVWLIRLSTKIFISHLHLGIDTYERVTMIKTYFALLAEKRSLNDDDRELILQTLFRPSSTGFIKDDGPITIPETLVNTLKRR